MPDSALLIMDVQNSVVKRLGDLLRDGCADADQEVHRVLLERSFPAKRTYSLSTNGSSAWGP